MKNRFTRDNALKYIRYLALAAMLLQSKAYATTTPANAITPFSWTEFKAVYGLPSTPTVPDNSAQIDTYNGTQTAADTTINAGEQLRAYRIGDYGLTPPPSGSNNFFDLQAGVGDSLVNWAAPFYGSSAASAQDLTVDDDDANNSVTLTPPGGTPTTTVYGGFAESGLWTDVTAATAQEAGEDNYYGDSYQIIPATSRVVEDDSDNGVSHNYAHWVPYIQTAGFYTAYAYFPSQDLAPATGSSYEPHVTDARYTIIIQAAGQALHKYTVTVDQQGGGAWVPLGGAHYFPATSTDGQFPTPAPTDIGIGAYPGYPTGAITSSTPAFVDIRVDDTTANATTTIVNGTAYQNYIVADAIQLRGGDALATREYGTPVAVNTTPPILASQSSLTNDTGTRGDYTEIALGYGAGASTGDGKTGGKPVRYQTDYKVTSGVFAGDFLPATTALGTAAQVFAGSVGYDATLPTAPPTVPIDQVVYFTRTEDVVADPNDVSQTEQVGYVYAVNGESGDVIWRYPNTAPYAFGDTDSTQFTLLNGTWTNGANTASSFNNETYDITPAVSSVTGATAEAQWKPANLSAGTYFVYAYFPSQGGGENHVASAHYTITDATGNTYSCYVNQQNGGQWVQLTSVNTSTNIQTTTFSLNSGSTVVLSNDTTDFTGANSSKEVVCADAIEFVPRTSMGSVDSTPAVVRNMKVYDAASGTYISRTVVIVTDNLGKVYCLDASGNEDGDDTLYDANNLPVYINSAGQGFETYNAASGALTNAAPTPWHPLKYGTTSVYWIWQPNSNEPITSSEIVDDSQSTQTSFVGNWIASTGYIVGAYLNNCHVDRTTVPRSTATSFDTFTWSPTIGGTDSGTARVYVSVGANNNDGYTHVSDARYTVVDETGTAYQCQPIDQTPTTPGFVQLIATTGQSLFNFGTPTGAGANTVFLDNSTAGSTVQTEVVADAVEFVFNGGVDPNSNLISPLAFQTCSPTVHVVPDSSLTVPSVTNATTGTTINYDAYDAKIYVGNSNGVLYALDGAGVQDGSNFYQRDLSEDPAMPSPTVDWWFNVGVTATNIYGQLEDSPNYITESIAGTPAYFKNPAHMVTSYDMILFTTFSPLVNGTGGINSGNLYCVNAIGPVGDYGAGTVPDQVANYATAYPSAAGTSSYNLGPIPMFSFPDAYGSPHVAGTSVPITLPSSDHKITSYVPTTTLLPNVVPPAHSLGDAGGSPVVFGGINIVTPQYGTTNLLPYRVFFAANDPTVNNEQPTEGRIWGVDVNPYSSSFGTVDTVSGYPGSDNIGSYIYPFPVPPTVASPPTSASTYTPVAQSAVGSFDPNILSTTNYNAISNIYDYNDTTGSTATTGDDQQFGPFTDGPNDVSGSANGYYVSSSPAAAIVHSIATGSGNTLPPILVAGPNPAGGNYPTEYGSATGAYDQDIAALYVGDLDGTLHTLNLGGTTDFSRYLQDVPLDGSAVESTPCVLANGNGSTPFVTTDTGGNNAGGVVFTTTQDGDLFETEALPFIESSNANITNARGVDFQYGGPGGYSSVASASFNIDNFTFTRPTTATSTDAGVDTSEWLYAGSDGGFCYGLAPSNTALGNGYTGGNPGGFNPGAYINPNNTPPNNVIPGNRNFITAVLTSEPSIVGGKLQFSNAGRPPSNNVFDWGQKVYIVFYGLDDPTAGSGATAATATYPRALRLTFSISPLGNTTVGIARGGAQTIDLQAVGNALPVGGASWPPTGFTLESPTATTSAADPSLIGPYGAVYVYQLGEPSRTSPQTPGSKVTLQRISEQVEYYTGTGTNATLVFRAIQARTDPGTPIRVSNGSGGYTDEQTPPIDQATFAILNPLAIRALGRTLGATGSPQATYGYYPLTLVPSNYSTSNEIYQLGPFSGADTNDFATFQDADANGNSVPATEPAGGTITTASGTINPNDPTANQIARTKSVDITVAVSPGMINHGSTGVSSTPNSAGGDPATSSISASDNANGPALDTIAPDANDTIYGESLLDIADRSALGLTNQALTDIQMNANALQWNDNSGSGGAMAVVNPLPWENMPTAFTTLGSHANNSRDYPDIPAANSSIELLPRQTALSSQLTGGTDTIISNTPGTLATAVPDSSGNAVVRTITPNAALLRIQVPKYQPANLDSYNPATNPGVLETGTTRVNSTAANVGQGYQETSNIYAVAAQGLQFRPGRDAYRSIQVWTSVPVDLSTQITEQTIDVGSVPAGFGLNLAANGSANNTKWTPFSGPNSTTPSAALNQFYKPITILNVGNTNLVNLHLNQFNYLNTIYSSATNPVPNPFGSYEASAESTIPSFDYYDGYSTGSYLEPIVRSSLDYNLPSGSTTNAYYQNGYEFTSQTVQPFPLGPTAHKPLVGDTNGAVVTVPDVPHNNLPNNAGSQNLNQMPYGGRPMISIAVPLATPVGKYSQTVNAFEGSDANSSVYSGPTYGGWAYTRNGWWDSSQLDPTNPSTSILVNGPIINTAQGTTYQTVSNPSTTLSVNVIEDRMTDGAPLPVTSSSSTAQAVLPQIDSTSTIANSPDMQPWATVVAAPGQSTTIGLYWASGRNATVNNPYSVYGSALVLVPYTDDGASLPSFPTEAATNGQWWTPATRYSEVSAIAAPVTKQYSYAPSSFDYNYIPYGMWVQAQVINGTTSYAVKYTIGTLTGGIPAAGDTLFTSTTPIFSPRAAYYISTPGAPGANATTGFSPTGAGTPPSIESSFEFPLIVYYTHIAGRSTLMYWPAAVTVNNITTIGSAPVPVPQEVTSVSTPTIIPRPVATVGGVAQNQIDISYSGQLTPNNYSDIIVGRYAITPGVDGTAVLTPAATLPPNTITVSGSTLTFPTVNESLTTTLGTSVWQARDIGWYVNGGAFQLTAQCTVNGSAQYVPLVPGASTGTYDHVSGQWVFSINWANLATAYPAQAQLINDIASWWTGVATSPPNIVVFARPGNGTITFSMAKPATSTISAANSEVFHSLSVNVDPSAQRVSFMSQSNSAPVSFIDDAYKPNAALQQPNVIASRYWYVYRKQTAAATNTSAATSVLYYDTRRLTLALPNPIQLKDNGSGSYTLPTDFDVKDANNVDVTSLVDVDWSRGRIYFPETYSSSYSPSEGQTFTVTYDYTNTAVNPAKTTTGTYTGIVSWMDEPQFNASSTNGVITGQSTIGEHVVPMSTPTNESEPSAFLDPNAGLGGSTLTLNPSSITPSTLSGQPFPHKVWIFWTSNRNASATGGRGSDIYWETLDPRFEVINP